MQRALQKKLIGPQAQRELLAFLGNHLPHFNTPASTAAWLKKAIKNVGIDPIQSNVQI